MNFIQRFSSFFWGNNESPVSVPSEELLTGDQKRTYSLNRPFPFLSSLLPPGSRPVSVDTVLSNPAFICGSRYISEGVAMLDRRIYRKDGKVHDSHPLFPLFNGRPNEQYTWFDMMSALVVNAIMGNGYLLVHRDERTHRPYGVELIPSEMCWPDYDVDGSLVYRIGGVLNGRVISLIAPIEDVIHIKGITLNGVEGRPMVLTNRSTFAAAEASKVYTESVFQNQARPSIAIKYEQSLTEPERQDIENNIYTRHSGPDKIGFPLVIDDGMSIQYIQWSPHDVALVDFNDLSVRDIGRLLKLSADFLLLDEKGTYGAAKQKSSDFLTHTLGPWKEKIEEEFNTKLFFVSEFTRRTAYFQFDVSKYVQLDKETEASVREKEANRLSKLISSMVLTPNEARAEMGLSPKPGGDVLYGDINFLPLDALVEVALAKHLSMAGEKARIISQTNATDDEQEPESTGSVSE